MKKIIFIFFQLLILWSMNELGSFIVNITHVPLPDNVVGMVLCFILLLTGILKLHWIDTVASFLIKHFAFFFIPISVGLMTLGKIFLNNGVVLLCILCVSAIAGISTTGYLSQSLMNKEKEKVHDHHHSL